MKIYYIKSSTIIHFKVLIIISARLYTDRIFTINTDAWSIVLRRKWINHTFDYTKKCAIKIIFCSLSLEVLLIFQAIDSIDNSRY